MSADILDGKQFSGILREQLKIKVLKYIAQGKRPPRVVVVLVGNHPASEVYVRNKIKACEAAGIGSEQISLSETITEAELLTVIADLNHNDEVDGILVQLPLPRQIDPHKILLAIGPEKDVDGFHPENMGLLALKMPAMRPATPKGIMMMLEHYIGDVLGMNAVVLGASNIVGRPMFLELLNRRATVTVCHSKTKDLPSVVRSADLVIAAVGIPEFVKGDWVKPGAIVVDVGINRLADGRLVGDVDFKEVIQVASWISPVPGGVGPMTIAGLLDNTLMAYEKRIS